MIKDFIIHLAAIIFFASLLGYFFGVFLRARKVKNFLKFLLLDD